MPIQLPYTGVTTTETIPAPYTNGNEAIDLTLKEDKANKGVANGYAPLDANAKVPVANLPDQASLDAEVDGKITTHNSVTTSVHGIANTANLVLTDDARLSDTRDPKAHTHTKSNITDFAHTHAISDVTNLQSKLDTKQEYYYTPVTYSSDYTIQSTLSDTGSIERHFHFTISGTPTYNPATDSGIYINFPTTGKLGDIITITNSFLKTDGFANNVALLLRERSGTTNNNFGTLAVGTTQSYVRKSSNSGFGNWTYLAPTVHTHAIADVTGLQTALNGKQASGSYAPATGIAPSAITGTAVVTNDSRLSDPRTPTAHTHTMSDVTSLQATLTAFAIALG